MPRVSACTTGPASSDRLADDVDDAPERAVADRHRDRLAGVVHGLAADETLGGVHGDGANRVLAEMLRDLENEPDAVVVGLERVQDLRKVLLEVHVDDGTDDLRNVADILRHGFLVLVGRAGRQCAKSLSRLPRAGDAAAVRVTVPRRRK